ncbi:MAG: hypothetical protein CL816_06810 [Coxiellaceae bacterium]|nr:hypothetical protein [Coxiellaceae bacterium]
MIKTLGTLLLTSSLLVIAPNNLWADDCNTWQNSPESVDVASLTSVSISDVQNCMATCNTHYLSSDSNDLSPAICAQNVSYIEYLTAFANNSVNDNTTLSTSSSSSNTSSTVSTSAPPPSSASKTQTVSKKVETTPPPTSTNSVPTTTQTEKPKSSTIKWF